MPKGEWLWLAIWMLPVKNTYGTWPMSGEIDIVESRGNGPLYTFRGSNYVQGSLNWGPTTWFFNSAADPPNPSEQDFHTYVLEWTPTFMRIYVDSRLKSLLFLKLNKPFFERGDFPKFYLILNVGVGGTNGWFPDGQEDKPWIDASDTAIRDFTNAQSTWSATWPEDDCEWGMVVDYMKMWRHCDY
ncbi:concanavalin A-like lectin/glucanase [Gymnopus androsaceus JB14]|uniref:Concanavalin A-like lectin/glucanase n=1 Tax=Gymnopus androsaceus JB14 TaxID=1447944 RepID=A0A6A4GCD8_9AGAR|nr:concanavalin A-like lectin/glucanase [Gymnopus androsaceus JB14]